MTSEHSEEYLLHQAREFHNYAKENITRELPNTAAVANLCISLEYLLDYLEKRCATP